MYMFKWNFVKAKRKILKERSWFEFILGIIMCFCHIDSVLVILTVNWLPMWEFKKSVEFVSVGYFNLF